MIYIEGMVLLHLLLVAQCLAQLTCSCLLLPGEAQGAELELLVSEASSYILIIVLLLLSLFLIMFAQTIYVQISIYIYVHQYHWYDTCRFTVAYCYILVHLKISFGISASAWPFSIAAVKGERRSCGASKSASWRPERAGGDYSRPAKHLFRCYFLLLIAKRGFQVQFQALTELSVPRSKVE